MRKENNKYFAFHFSTDIISKPCQGQRPSENKGGASTVRRKQEVTGDQGGAHFPVVEI